MTTGPANIITSNHPLLKVKRAGKSFLCAGVAVERGARPGSLRDVWMWSRSRRCSDNIKQGALYVANSLIPDRVRDRAIEGWLPLCMYCAVDSYSEYFDGPRKLEYVGPLSESQRARVLQGLTNILEDADALSKALTENQAA